MKPMTSKRIFYSWLLSVAFAFTFCSILLKVFSFQVVGLIFQGCVLIITLARLRPKFVSVLVLEKPDQDFKKSKFSQVIFITSKLPFLAHGLSTSSSISFYTLVTASECGQGAVAEWSKALQSEKKQRDAGTMKVLLFSS